MGSQSLSQFQIVDFTIENMKPGTDTWLSTCHVVRTALEDQGCLVARFDKVSKELCDSVILAVKELFSLPLETKTQKTSDKLFHSYYGQVPTLPLVESLAIEDPLSMDQCQKFAHTMWPQGNDPFCETINEYTKLVGELDKMVKRMVFESYGVDMKKYDCLIESSYHLLRCLQYRRPQKDENDRGLESHSDLTITSILHQLNDQYGLEIRLKNGEWTLVEVPSSFFVIMAGDVFHVWSNGRIHPCQHRVSMKAKETRYSMGLFSFGNMTMQIPEELINEQNPLLYKPTFHNYEYFRYYDKERTKETDSRIQAYFGI